MNRRDFLKTGSTAALATLATNGLLVGQTPATSGPAAASRAVLVPTEFKPLRRNVGYFTGRGGSIGWLSNSDSLVAVDSQYPDTGALFLAGIPDRADRHMDLLVNTHHHADHTSGNFIFKPVTKSIVAHQNVPKLQFQAAEAAATLDKQAYADTTFDSVWRRDLGQEIVTAQYYGPGHTKGDIVVTFEKANVVHMGDLVFNRAYPVIDRKNGGNISSWIRILNDARKNYPKDALFIYGHGNPKFGVSGNIGDLGVMADYLLALLEHVQKQIAAGKAKPDIVTLENLPGFDDFHSPLPNRFSGNLSVAYDELTEKS